jgi:hypothetical protein
LRRPGRLTKFCRINDAQGQPGAKEEMMSDEPGQDEQAIRARAYALWQQAGSPEGRALEFWRHAEAEAAPRKAPPSEAALDEDIEESVPASDATNRS